MCSEIKQHEMHMNMVDYALQAMRDLIKQHFSMNSTLNIKANIFVVKICLTA